MLSRTHIAFSTAATFAGSVYLNTPFFLPLIIFNVLGAITPDIDHQSSEISRKVPMVHKLLKHRGPTHSLFGVGVFTGLAFLLAVVSPVVSVLLAVISIFGATVLSKQLSGFSKKLFEASSRTKNTFIVKDLRNLIYLINIVPWVLLALSLILIFNDEFGFQVFVLLVAGYVMHIAGDIATKEGVPLLWPYRKRLKLQLFKTGATAEHLLLAVLVLLNIFFLYEFIVKYEVYQLVYWNILSS